LLVIRALGPVDYSDSIEARPRRPGWSTVLFARNPARGRADAAPRASLRSTPWSPLAL